MVNSEEWLKNIIHEVHDEKLLIAYFSLSKDETSKTSNASVHGVQAYTDLENVSYKRGRKISVEGTTDSYIKLYKRCWNYNLNQRPELGERKFWYVNKLHTVKNEIF
ncbi:hypothetical protein C2G38_2200218 [Gigaspora rosea]|uniref:Uncharacterized protein n=1 Tax=Gigaspora rosea TaxID=44941 RepID=A0A397UQX5_9GLOM|nr:hypothetical protein C2G38_2200218 [Gigaspora rosea]